MPTSVGIIIERYLEMFQPIPSYEELLMDPATVSNTCTSQILATATITGAVVLLNMCQSQASLAPTRVVRSHASNLTAASCLRVEPSLCRRSMPNDNQALQTQGAALRPVEAECGAGGSSCIIGHWRTRRCFPPWFASGSPDP